MSKKNEDNDSIRLSIESSSYTFYKDDSPNGDMGEGALLNALKIAGLASEAFENKEATYDVKNVKVGDYVVYYAEFENNTLGYEESVSKNIYAAFYLGDNYTIDIRMSSFSYNKDAGDISVETLKSIVETFQLEVS